MSGAFLAASGRAVVDGELRESRSGKSYGAARMAVAVEERREGESGDPDPWWLRVLAFGQAADVLAAVRKGEVLHAAGRLERQPYTARDGTEREGWTLLADTVIAARPGSRSGGARSATPEPGREPVAAGAVAESDIPF